MTNQLGKNQNSTHLTGVTKVEVTNQIPKDSSTHTIQLCDHKPGDFTIELDIDKGYMYLTNLSQSSIDYRLNSEAILRHIQKHRKVALMRNDQITLFIPYIDQNDELNSSQLKIHLLDDLSLKFELV